MLQPELRSYDKSTVMKSMILLGVVLIFASCASIKSKKSKIYWVNSYKVDCVGVGPMKCYLVQQGESIIPGQWQYFYSKIEGFDFMPGYLYKLKVKEENLENAPADASSIKYTLLNIMEKKQDQKLRINDIWVVSAIDGKEIELLKENGNHKNAQIEIHIADMRIMGNDGCNNFNGRITTFADGIIEFGPIAGTRMMCADMTIPDKFNIAISKVKKYKIKNMELTFFDKADAALITFKKID